MNWWVRLIRWAAYHPQFISYLLVVGALATGMWRVETIARDAQRTADELHEVVLDNEAQRCVDDWERVEDMRRIGPVSNEALIEALPDADPAKVQAVKEATARRVDQVVIDPDCDLEAARRRLAD